MICGRRLPNVDLAYHVVNVWVPRHVGAYLQRELHTFYFENNLLSHLLSSWTLHVFGAWAILVANNKFGSGMIPVGPMPSETKRRLL